MPSYSFDATEPDGSPRKYIGMHRPPRLSPKGYVQCNCGDILQVMQALESHWQMGHFDVPLYEIDSPAGQGTENA